MTGFFVDRFKIPKFYTLIMRYSVIQQEILLTLSFCKRSFKMFTFFAIFKVFDITDLMDLLFLWFYEIFNLQVVVRLYGFHPLVTLTRLSRRGNKKVDFQDSFDILLRKEA